jgi:hypothetical protein
MTRRRPPRGRADSSILALPGSNGALIRVVACPTVSGPVPRGEWGSGGSLQWMGTIGPWPSVENCPPQPTTLPDTLEAGQPCPR